MVLPITDYGNGEYATLYAADIIATDIAVSKLIKKEVKFAIVTTPDTSEFSFSLSSYGDFFVYWGDGTKEELQNTEGTKTGVSGCVSRSYEHTYAKPGMYKIGFGGLAKTNCTYTGSTVEKRYHYAAISFDGNKNIAKIAGSLGKMFPTSSITYQPKFYRTFADCTNLEGEIPDDLFFGISGALSNYMFTETFANCSGLIGASARIDATPLYEIWPSATTNQVSGCYSGVTELTDYDNIPEKWK